MTGKRPEKTASENTNGLYTAGMSKTLFCATVLLLAVCSLACGQETADRAEPYFGIQVVDAETGRGVPMVGLSTVNNISYYTDSAGWIAFHEPGLMGKQVFFHVRSHGYEFPKDGFGYRGLRLQVEPGATARVEIQRKNIAERLYRITGQGIYRDSVLLGQPFPLDEPLLNGDVLGQDTVQTGIYNGKIYWIWGDTNRPSYPLGQFKTSGATSSLPEQGGLDPARGINLEYFADDNGFSRQMAPVEGPGAVWLHGLFVLRDGDQEKMIAHYARVKSLGERYEHGLVLFNDETQTFEKLLQFNDDAVLYPRGQVVSHPDGTGEYIYFATPFPSVRVEANHADIQDPSKYEAFTCLEPGQRYDTGNPRVERDAEGQVVWGWKKDTDTMDARRQYELIQGGFLKPQDVRLVLNDPHSDKPVYMHAGSVHWNPFRQRWIMLGLQMGGETSFIGEMWYAES